MGNTIIYIFFGLWTAFLFISVISLKGRGKASNLLPLLVIATSLVLLLAIMNGFRKEFPIWVKEYTYSPEKSRVYIGNSGEKSQVVLFNPLADERHLEINFGKTRFQLENVSPRRRVDFDGQGMDILSMSPGKKIKILNNNLKILKFYTPGPFSRKIEFEFAGHKNMKNFILNSKKVIKKQNLNLVFSYSPPSFFFLNLYLLELLLLILAGILIIYFYLSKNISLWSFILNILILSGIIFMVPLWIPGLLLGLFLIFEKGKHRFIISSILIFMIVLPFIKKGTVNIRAYEGKKRLSFSKTYAYGTHHLVIGRTSYKITILPSHITLYPLSVEGINAKPSMITYGDTFLIEFHHLTIPFPESFSPVFPGHKKNVLIEGKGGRLVLSTAAHPLIISGIKYLLSGFLFFALSLVLIYIRREPYRLILISNFYFMLIISMEFFLAASLFNSAFYFNFKSYIKYGYIPALLLISGGLFFTLNGPGALRNLFTGGLTIKERINLFLYETRKGKPENIFELISKPVSRKFLRVDFLFLTSLVLIALQFILGSETGIKTSGFSFQLFEAGKILLAIYLADWLFRAEENKFVFPFWLPYFLTFIPFVFLIFTIGDFSPLIIFAPVLAIHFILLKGNPGKKLLALGVFIIAAVIGAYLSIHLLFPRDVALRIMAWVHPGVFTDYSEQFIRAFWLFREGGFSGNFPSAFKLAHFVPLVQFDFPLALFSANFGIAGISLLFLTLLVPTALLIKHGRNFQLFTYEKRWNFYALFFSTILFMSQAAVPFLIMTGLLPVMGQPFPFISKANSNLLFFTVPYYLLMVYLMGGREHE